jgi:hypothetical protein
MGAIVNYLSQRWRAQPDDMIGGWCVTPEADKRTPAQGAPQLADFSTEELARHIAQLHNVWLQSRIHTRG